MKTSSGPNKRALLGKFFYGSLFGLLTPAYLVFWAVQIDALTFPSVPAAPLLGWIIAALGLGLVVLGMVALWVHGKGLPMNAYPPSRYVRQGVFRWVSHPIYIGFVLICLGVSLALLSGAGLWVISPVVALACTSLVWGYERPALLRRFGTEVSPPWIRLPPHNTEMPIWRDRISVVLLVFLPWLILYEVVEYVGVVQPVLDSTLTFEKDLPVWAVSVVPYMMIYPLVALAPFYAKRRDELREFAVGGIIATFTVIPFYLTVPVIAPFREISADTVLADLLLWQQSFDRPVTAFPAFHVVWLLLAIKLYAQTYPTMRVIFWVTGFLIAISCWTTGMHALLDIVAGLAVYAALAARNRIWKWILGLAERIANSWQEWRFGSMRLINHGLYAGLAAAVGFMIVGYFSDPHAFWASVTIGISSIVGAGIWGQILDGSKKLLRPFGYYGAVLGAAIGILIADQVFDQDILPIAAALSVAAPWVQAIGRCRCLVQGCCHGAETSKNYGIHYRHAGSRVLQIAGLGGRALHPTPVYSMISNVAVGLFTMRLLLIGAPSTFIVGTYLMLSGLARFVEEAHRGEPQTQVFGGLKVYQWTALISFLSGSVLTMYPSAAVGLQHSGFTPTVWAGSLAFGVLVTVAMGVDWPESNRRFSRLN